MANECHLADELTSFIMLKEISAGPEARAQIILR
jgi:hypothetical protein